MTTPGSSYNSLTIVIPVYNEEEVLPEFYARLSQVADELDVVVDFLFVNDGSTDSTLDVLQRFRVEDPRVAIIDLSRNFGKEIALTAGLDYAAGDAVVVIDADLQDPPEVIPKFIEFWRAGYDIVYAKRDVRRGETRLKLLSASLFYKVMQLIGPVSIPKDTGDFRLLSRRSVEALKKLREQHRFMKGLFAWIGFPQKEVLYQRDARYAGNTKWNYWKLWNFALEGITSFTTIPLRIATYIGFLTAAFAFIYGALIIIRTAVYGSDLPGYPSLLVVILFLGGIQLMAIGIIGEYLGRMFDETKNRPLYFVSSFDPSRSEVAPEENEPRERSHN